LAINHYQLIEQYAVQLNVAWGI